MKTYNQAPLPFQGQKRRFLRQFKDVLNNYTPNATYIDLFGGSGLLSHTVKQYYPEAKVIWNDYDNYLQRLEHIEQTNALLSELRPLLKHEPRKVKVPEPTKKKLLEVIKTFEASHGYVDYVTLSAQLLFSGKFAADYNKLAKETWYNRITLSPYQAEGYLNGVQRVQADYKLLFSQTKRLENVVYLVDPPYLSTDTTTYGSNDYWRLRDYLDVLSVLDGSDYFYFTSNKSQIIELCEWIETRTLTGNPFSGSNMITTNTSLNKDARYTDIMIYKLKSPD